MSVILQRLGRACWWAGTVLAVPTLGLAPIVFWPVAYVCGGSFWTPPRRPAAPPPPVVGPPHGVSAAHAVALRSILRYCPEAADELTRLLPQIPQIAAPLSPEDRAAMETELRAILGLRDPPAGG